MSKCFLIYIRIPKYLYDKYPYIIDTCGERFVDDRWFLYSIADNKSMLKKFMKQHNSVYFKYTKKYINKNSRIYFNKSIISTYGLYIPRIESDLFALGNSHYLNNLLYIYMKNQYVIDFNILSDKFINIMEGIKYPKGNLKEWCENVEIYNEVLLYVRAFSPILNIKNIILDIDMSDDSSIMFY